MSKDKIFKIEKFQSQYQMMYQWVLLKQNGIRLASYFEERKIYNLAIYGIGEIALILYEELKDEPHINLACGIDIENRKRCGDLRIILPQEMVEENCVEAIVVTPIGEFRAIRKHMKQYFKKRIISLDDVVYGCRI